MPANLTPQYLAAEQRFKEAVTPQEKIDALQEMMAVIPKHKGTEKLQAALKRKMAKLQVEKDSRHGVSRAAALYTVPKEGVVQAVLIGSPNVGKSALLAALTHAAPEVADYPYTTRLPRPGMMPFENIQIQLVDTPPIAPESYRPWMGNLVRQADLTLLVVDTGSDDLLDQVDGVLKTLEDSRIRLVSPDRAALEAAAGVMYAKTLLVANKCDRRAAKDNRKILEEFFLPRFEIVAVSCMSGEGIEHLRELIFSRLEVIRIYTKAPGKKVDLDEVPFVLKRGSTVVDAARAVHRDLENSLKFARVWSSSRNQGSVRYDGQKVERTHQLEDGDILELHE